MSIISVAPRPDTAGLAERLVRRRLAAIRDGLLVVDDGDGVRSFGAPSARCPLVATVRVHDRRFYGEVAWGGSVGAGEAYMLGYWSADDLTVAMRILLCNRDALDGLEAGLAALSAPARKVMHWAARNTRDGSRRNIGAHYDLGNDFFARFLDPTMMYSSAVFERPDMTLQEASIAKLDRICQRLRLGAADHVLEIGTGWGGFALHAAQHYGCRVTTTTISEQQYQLATERVISAGLQQRITVLRQDYRDLTGRYDKLVSIEMIEAVGHEYLGTFFAKCAGLLKDNGAMLLQAITIDDRRYDSARRSVDFIRKHIFPGSCIPSVSALTSAAARASDLRLLHLDDIGSHYARTLALWRENLRRAAGDLSALGHSAEFLRKWEFYFCYCEAGFAERALGDVQALFVKPDARFNGTPIEIRP
jgi:cyclopropane-fatty-acyl-phospholipid synthase